MVSPACQLLDDLGLVWVRVLQPQHGDTWNGDILSSGLPMRQRVDTTTPVFTH